MDFNWGEIILVVLSGLSGAALTLAVTAKAKVEAYVKSTPNKVDDGILEFALKLAQSIATAKAEDPTKPLGEK